MADAAAKFRAHLLSKKWSAPAKEQGQILTLTAQVKKLKTKSKSKIKQPSAAALPLLLLSPLLQRRLPSTVRTLSGHGTMGCPRMESQPPNV